MHSALVLALLLPGHIALDEPVARTGDQKTGPCGTMENARTDRVTAYPPGATISVRFEETIDHPGHFRVAFDDDGTDFPTPAGFDDTSGGPTVLFDGIEDKAGGEYQLEVTLPDVECERCTLQLIQVMSDKAPFGDGNDIYFQCADLVLREGASPDGEYEGPELGCACAAVPYQSGGVLGVLTTLAALGFARRRRGVTCRATSLRMRPGRRASRA